MAATNPTPDNPRKAMPPYRRTWSVMLAGFMWSAGWYVVVGSLFIPRTITNVSTAAARNHHKRHVINVAPIYQPVHMVSWYCNSQTATPTTKPAAAGTVAILR